MQNMLHDIPYILQSATLIAIGVSLTGLAGLAAVARKRPTIKLKVRK